MVSHPIQMVDQFELPPELAAVAMAEEDPRPPEHTAHFATDQHAILATPELEVTASLDSVEATVDKSTTDEGIHIPATTITTTHPCHAQL